jgi:multimeric flavodoxin WrbA
MARKIIFFCGSPNAHGHTNTLVEKVAREATALGAQVEIVDVPALEWKVPGCNACMECQSIPEYRCTIDDEASAAVGRALQADVVVLATPVYFAAMTGQLKCLVDRMYSLVKIKEGFKSGLAGKQMVLVATAGSQEGLQKTHEYCHSLAAMTGKPLLSLLATAEQLAETAKIDAQVHQLALTLTRE